MFTNKLLSGIVFATLLNTATVFAGPLDDGINECGVPVCNVSETIEGLTALNEDQRYNYINKMVNKYSDSENLEVLNNLLDTAKKAKDISVSSEDADWVVRESSTLANAMVIGLAKYSEVEAKVLSGFYKQITSDLKRFEIIEFWSKKVNTVEDVKKLNELVLFAQNAKAHSEQLGDEAWIPRGASALMSKITIKLTMLDPIHEGLYSVDSIMTGETQGILPFDKVAVLDSSAQENLVVIFYNSKFKRASFIFNGVALAGNILSSKSISNTQTSKEFSFELNRTTGAIKGVLTTTDTTINFSGKQTFSTNTVFSGQTPSVLTEEDAIGQFEGKIGSRAMKLTVKSFLPGVYSATLRDETGAVKKDFKGKFFPKNGVLTLTHNSNLKLIISLRMVDGKAVWTGVSYSVKRPTAIKAVFNKL